MEALIQPSSHLHKPHQGKLLRFSRDSELRTLDSIAAFEMEFKALVSQKDYPCVAALRSYHKDDYQVGFYGNFGNCEEWRNLRNDLLFFLQEQKKTNSIYLSFFAVFKETILSEEEFEQAMWKELSYLTSEEDRANDWAEGAVKDPLDPGFRFSLSGSEFFVVGLHPQSSRKARQFSRPILIFNIFDQFEELKKLGQYDSMVALNRARDLRFQGSVNPMVETYGEDWESIQFSGKSNPKTWKCPFSFLKQALKG
jgi:hypothetical protein